MKVRNLLLAGLAMTAMAACSNNDEFIDNSIQAPTGEQATMRINFAVPVSGNTRAANDGGADAGSKEESTIL